MQSNGKIYVLRDDQTLQALVQQPFQNEELLQSLLAKYPDVLAGEQIDEASPRRWLFVSREVGVPNEPEGSERWSLDHLFLDQDAIPTLVEVKRSSDGRIRREVVGQMLDYAANAVVYWSVETIRAAFDAACQQRGANPEEAVLRFLESESADENAVEAFWGRVKTNLQAKRIRLVFVADEIPPELRRIIEFLNEQMDPAEVLGVEVRQFVGDDLRTLVPRVVGQTADAERAKGAGTREKREWNRDSFIAEMESRHGVDAAEAAGRILDWIEQRVGNVRWGQGTNGSFTPVLQVGDVEYSLFRVYVSNCVEIPMRFLKDKPAFQMEDKRRAFLARLKEIPGANLPAENLTGLPSLPLSVLHEGEAFAAFQRAVEWAIHEAEGTARRSE